MKSIMLSSILHFQPHAHHPQEIPEGMRLTPKKKSPKRIAFSMSGFKKRFPKSRMLFSVFLFGLLQGIPYLLLA
jgi:hypothetical protein